MTDTKPAPLPHDEPAEWLPDELRLEPEALAELADHERRLHEQRRTNTIIAGYMVMDSWKANEALIAAQPDCWSLAGPGRPHIGRCLADSATYRGWSDSAYLVNRIRERLAEAMGRTNVDLETLQAFIERVLARQLGESEYSLQHQATPTGGDVFLIIPQHHAAPVGS